MSDTRCPYCDAVRACPHFIGWTQDGVEIILRNDGGGEGVEPLRDTDKTIPAVGTLRVYRGVPAAIQGVKK
jgi:hypothetical protein